MLSVIDARSLLMASAVVFAGLVLSVVLAWRELKPLSGPDRIAKSYVLFLVGLVLFAFQDHLPALFSVWAANVLVVLGAALVLEGTQLILGLPHGRKLTVWTTVAATAAFGYFTFVRDDTDGRTILSSAFLAALLGTAGWTSWRRRPRNGSQTLETVTSVALGACALLFWARAVAIGTGLVQGEMLKGSPWLAVPPLLCALCAVVWTTTLLANTSRRLMCAVQSKNDLLASLLSVARAAGDESNLDATLERVLAATIDLTGAGGASLLMLDEEGRFARGVFSHEATNLAVEKREAEIILEKGLAAWVVRNRSMGVVFDVDADPRWHHSPSLGEKARSALSAPISSGPALAGVLTLIHTEPGHFGDEHRLLLESTTAQIALALRNAQIADARQQATRGQELLNQILEVSARQSDAKDIVTLAAGALSRGSSWPRVYLAIAGEDGHFRLYGRTDGIPDPRPRIDEGILGSAMMTGATQRDDAPTGAEAQPGRWSRLAVPLRHLGRTLGVAAFESSRPRAFESSDVDLAEALAEAVSLGLGKAAFARSREEMTRMMVHDLRGPIAGVMGALELLGGAPAMDNGSRRLLDAAEKNTRRQLKLIEGILELGRLEEGALPVQREVVRIAALVEEVLQTMMPTAEARGLELVSQVPEALPCVVADSALVSRVLENLVGNAVKFSQPGAGPIRVSARLAGTMVDLLVEDSGPGVEETLRPRIFEKFVVGTHVGRGSGLGLAFCRLAVEAQGGRIRLEHPGPRAVFAFSLPLAEAPAV
ncbi:MAG: GAF domain-containing sensor histidine kinase [Deltaproteobacteria bacterium]|nr:GAF domain-containing sensor histidine kinase [Deltaproteobacteria bacterium]